jgi:hypothetical protein
MDRKRIGWASLIALVLLMAMMVMVLTGCGPRSESESETEKGYRFSVEKVYSDTYSALYLITDKETGKQWVVFDGYNCGGIAAYE